MAMPHPVPAAVSVVIVSYECREHLLRCLTSLRQAGRELATEIIVIDNASTDGTVAAVRQRFPEVEVVASTRNRGFAWACNRGIERSTGRFVLLLNPDTVVPADGLSRAVEALESRPTFGMLGCKLVRPDGRLDKACKRGIPTPLGSLAYFTGLSRLAPRSRVLASYTAGHVGEDETAPVDAVNGAFMLVRREAIDEVGPLDERYWLYMEDLDWCHRFALHGWPVLYWPEVEVVHVKGASAGRLRRWRTNYAFHRGMWLFYRTHEAPGRSLPVTAAVWLGIWSKFALSVANSAVRRGAQRLHSAAAR